MMWAVAFAVGQVFILLCLGLEVVGLPLDKIAEARECAAEVALARRFLEGGLLINAAGKAFQAWKSYLSYVAIKNLDLLQF